MERAEREAGNRPLLLKTQTIGAWVERRGYRHAGLAQIPESVRTTTEFQGSLCSCCPAYIKGGDAGAPPPGCA
ncbi:MAG: hypothetical protein P4L36_02340 [Holophaga sp.]|nr:hypothetical protein [Holophaga sp.]